MNTKPNRPAAPAAAAKYRGRSSAPAKIDARVIAVWCLVVVAGGAVAAIVWEPWQHLPSAQEQTLQAPNLTPPPILSTPSLGGASLATTGQNPAPYQYDPIKDQHWVPGAGHEHWHAGKPPANAGTTAAATSSIQNPQPWQYDPVTNQHWDPSPGHQHWHSGQPPANAGTTTATTTAPAGTTARLPAPGTVPSSIQNPQPWQYDEANDQYWHPDHAHWHPGPPPGNPPIKLGIENPQDDPKAWFHDEANNQHWDPVHKHWHPGPPPAGKVPATLPPAESKDEPASQDKPASEAESDSEGGSQEKSEEKSEGEPDAEESDAEGESDTEDESDADPDNQ